MGPYLNASLTTALVLLVLGGIIRLEQGRRNPWPLLVVALPMKPLVSGIWEGLGRNLPPLVWPWAAISVLFLVPAVEEGAKLLPLGLRPWRGWLEDRREALVAGLALGTGFGLGGIWLEAWRLGREIPLVFQGPFWQSLAAFGAEGFLACFFQATASALLATAFFQGHRWAGYLLAISYRVLGEMGAFFERWGKWSFATSAWWLVLPIGLGAVVLLFLILQAAQGQVSSEWGRARLSRINPTRVASQSDRDEDCSLPSG